MKKAGDTYIDNEHFWFPLDNAAKIYPAVRSSEHTTVFRLSATLKEPLKIKCLLKAIDMSSLRFPYFRSKLRRGLFWYYLEYTPQPWIPKADMAPFCRAFKNGRKNQLLFRILVGPRKISVEFSHILTDGYGAYVFLATLLKYYLLNTGAAIPASLGIASDKAMIKEEFEDAYNRFFKADIPPVVKYTKAFHLPFPLRPKPRFRIITASLSLDEIKKVAKKNSVSITEYLTAVYLFVLQNIYHENRYKRFSKILRIQVPINLRNIYQSATLRNFSLFVMPEIDLRLGQYTFDEIVRLVYHKMQLETDKKFINKIIARNVGSERNLLVRGIPLFIKSLVLRYKFYSVGVNQYSGVITNLGKVSIPDPMASQIERFTLVAPPPNRKIKVNCGIIGYNNQLILTFGSVTHSNELEKRFLRYLVSRGIRVKLIQQ